jgi:hypothetical protein
MRSTTSTVLVPGWRCTRKHDAARVGEPGSHLVVLHAIDHASDFLQPHRIPIAIRHNHRAERFRIHQLPGGLYGVRLVRAPQRAGRVVDVVLLQGLLHLIDRDIPRCHQTRIELRADGVLLAAHDVHLRHAADHRNPLRHHRFGVLIHLGKLQDG